MEISTSSTLREQFVVVPEAFHITQDITSIYCKARVIGVLATQIDNGSRSSRSELSSIKQARQMYDDNDIPFHEERRVATFRSYAELTKYGARQGWPADVLKNTIDAPNCRYILIEVRKIT